VADTSPIFKFLVVFFIGCLLLIAAGIGLLFYLPDYNARKNGDVSLPTLASDINLDNFSISKAIIDSKHNIHLIYESDRNEYRYLRSSDLGKSWDEPDNQSSKSPVYHNSNFAAITIVGDTIVTWGHYHYSEHNLVDNSWDDINHSGLMRTISYDNGITWSPEQRTLIEKQLKNGLLGKTKFAFYGDTLFCLLETGENVGEMGLYVSKSGDLGFSWSEPKTLIAPQYYKSGSPISFCLSDSILFVGFQGRTQADGNINSIIVLRSTDYGESWGMLPQIYLENVSSGQTPRQYVTDMAMETHNKKLIVSLLYGYFKYYISDDNGETWQGHELKIRPEYGRAFFLNKNNELNLIWIDSRNSYRDWRDYLPAPLSYMLIWDDDPSWPNNDLYQQNLDKPNNIPKRLTPPYSYIKPPYLSVSDFGDSIMVMWLGREKVNSKYEAFSMPPQLLYKFIPQ
jgi:hypothetical protein